jgi:hypothetical protein
MFEDCTKNIVLLMVVMLCMYFMCSTNSKESFEGSTVANVNYAAGYDQSVDSMPERPTYYDPLSEEMILSEEFVKQPLDYAWGKPYADGSDDGEMKSVDYSSVDLRTAPCSKSCCSSQYPTPFKLRDDKNVCANKGKFVPNNLICNNEWQDSGCMCLTQKQSDFLSSRGGNAL